MGAPTDMLVLVAIMYDNPKGLTKEEAVNIFQNKLNLTQNYSEFSRNSKFGLYGFANLFNLKHTEKYLKNRKKYWNEHYKYSTQREIIWRDKKLSVINTTHKKLGETILKWKGFDSWEFTPSKVSKEGDYVSQDYFDEIEVEKKYENSKNNFLIKKVLDINIKQDNEDPNFSEIYQKLKVEVVQFNRKEFKFNSFEKLWEKYPEYHPEQKYNFNQSEGFLYPHKAYGINSKTPSFKWIKKEGKYFLDFENFSRIINPNSYFGEDNWKHKNKWNKSRYSLTDVILTSEAIRRKNWKLLGYNAFFYYNKNFVYKNEKTLRRYEQAIFDTEVSVKAQKENLTNFEFLREHHFQNSIRKQVSHDEIKKMLKQENKQKGIEKRKNTIQRKKEEESKEPELPF